MRAGIQRLIGARKGAVAPTVALALFALIGAGGIAFDYAHLANMDTELQQAADQAALAAATQLDGSDGARDRATAAAQSLLNNTTLFASDDSGEDDTRRVTIATVTFYQSYDVVNDTYGAMANKDDNANVVRVSVGGRRADYALTPVVGAISSGTIGAEALASLSSAVCNVPPLMMCAPTDEDFPTAADVGKGVQLQPGPNVGAWVPGDYGYLDFGNGSSGLSTNLGRNNEDAGCIAMDNGIPTEPGNKASVTEALNSRFDLYPASASKCVTANGATKGDYCPSENTQKDVAKTYEVKVNNWDAPPALPPPNPGDDAACAAGQTWINGENSVDKDEKFSRGTSPQGMPRDTCHTPGPTGTCPGGKFGNGNWARDAYLGANNGTNATTVADAVGKTTATLTRYDVYKWQLLDKANRLAPKIFKDVIAPDFKEQGKSGKGTYTFTNRCSFPQPMTPGNAVVPSENQKDRRILTVAAVDCTGLTGKGNVFVKQWVDVFLVEPSLDRSAGTTGNYNTGKDEIYVEIIGVAKRPNGESAFQYYLRQRPRLIR